MASPPPRVKSSEHDPGAAESAAAEGVLLRAAADIAARTTTRYLSSRAVAEETLNVATATLSELHAQTKSLSRVAHELQDCEDALRQVITVTSSFL